LEQSVDEIIQRHEMLRTVFANEKGKPTQVIIPGQHVLNRIDLLNVSGDEQETLVRRLVDEEAKRPFDLSSGPLIRWHLLLLNTEEYALLFTMHHIISDGWSIEILIREIAQLYSAFEAGRPSPLPPLPIQYGDYALWQREWLQGTVLEQQLNYWRQQLRDLPILAFPTDHPRPHLQNHRGASVAFSLSQPLSEQLRRLSQQEGTTLFMTLLAAFQVLLARYCGQEDIVVGTPIANRRHHELEGLIGFFVNTLVVRSDLSGNPTFQQVLAQVRQVCLEAYAHQDVPFEKLVEVLQPSRDLTRHPLFQVFFGLMPAFRHTSGNRTPDRAADN
jgi:Condensation domain